MANITNNRPQPAELTKISESISMFIDSWDTPFTTREIQNFVQVKIGISFKWQQIVQHLRKYFKMSSRRVNSRPTIKDKHHILMLQSLFAVEVSSILSHRIVIVSIDEVMLSMNTKFNYSWQQKGEIKAFDNQSVLELNL